MMERHDVTLRGLLTLALLVWGLVLPVELTSLIA